MSRNNTVVVVNGRVRPINLDGALDITEKDQVDRWNKKMEKNHKKAVAIKIGIKQEPQLVM
jgi:predicted secreted protein